MDTRQSLSKILFVAILLLSIAAPSPLAQAPPTASSEIQHTATKPLEWDVISVKPVTNCTVGSGLQINPDGLHIFCLSLRPLLQIAWSINESSRILGAPSWAIETRYDIDAKVAGDDASAFSRLTAEQRNLMLQTVLQRRFHLNAHLESRELPVYNLVVARAGPKLKQASSDESSKAMIWMRNRGEIDSTSMPLHSVLSMLSRELDRPVVDRTGLTGTYDFTLHFTPATTATSDSQNPSIFTAIQEQLGLKLEPARAPLNVLIIDRVEQPTLN